MRLKLKQFDRVGSMGRKYMQGSQCLTDEDLEQVDAFAKKYNYEIGYCDVQLVDHGCVVDECIHII